MGPQCPALPMTTKSRSGSAVWQGGLKDGEGTVSTQSGALSKVPYAFVNRFGDEPGTNPEELIAAAHAACFSMALSGQLEGAGTPPASIDTKADVSFDKKEAGWRITAVHLDVEADVPDADEAAFAKAASAAKEGCPVSNVLNAEITMDARLTG